MITIQVEPSGANMTRAQESKTAKSLSDTFLFFIRVSGLFAVSYCAIVEFKMMSNQMEMRVKENEPDLEVTLEFFYGKHEAMCIVDDYDTASLERVVVTSLMISSSMMGIFMVLVVGGYVNSKVEPSGANMTRAQESKTAKSLSDTFLFFIRIAACLILYVIVSYCATVEFKMMSSQMEKRVEKEGEDLEATLEFFYRKHEVMCEFIESANKCLKPYLLLVFAVYIPMSCFILYAAIVDDTAAYDTASLERVVVTSLMISSSMIGIFMVLVVGGYVNSKANDMTGHLWKIKPSSLSERGLQTLTLFTTKLCGQSVGFSVYGLFTINMPAILTIFGTILAYFIVIFQFKPPDSVACPLCNCTTPA
ncbi:uncharacterized protein LOC121368799 [Gigantopelta aegis]|uniref:uncharacterized protein LOC121368799 n=1 Tax=Gigantopelta aegis TaxID=1735272 RepID=UPI001B88D83A|nr:uncharacterized protein LOC121368799 [Gigantopelta aegis]